MTNEVRELLDALHRGSMTLDEVAERFRKRRWLRRRSSPPATYLEMAAAEMADPEPYLPGSFDDVMVAYDQQKISREQLRVLSGAVADAQRAEDAEKRNSP
jgi:hypothetical protein